MDLKIQPIWDCDRQKTIAVTQWAHRQRQVAFFDPHRPIRL